MKTKHISIPLNSSKFKKAANVDMEVQIGLTGNKRLLPEDPIEGTVNAYEVYLKEREACNKFRLIFNISSYCTNVLFNPITEVVKYEGSSSATCLNFMELNGKELSKNYECRILVKDKESFVWSQKEAIRDTQLSNDYNGFTYHCGIDIFNNHILRNKAFRAVNYNELFTDYPRYDTVGDAYLEIGERIDFGAYDYIPWYGFSEGTWFFKNSYKMPIVDNYFNTLGDYMRDRFGIPVHNSYHQINASNDPESNSRMKMYSMPMHMYSKKDAYSYEDCIKSKLIEVEGWFGFKNNSLFNSSEISDKTVVITEAKLSIDKSLDFSCDEEGVEKTLTITAETAEVLGRIAADSLDINKVINSKNQGEFIDMYPERELFSFSPKYNPYQYRLEKNWNYCLTYPAEQVDDDDENMPFLYKNDRKHAILNVDRYDENVVGDDGLELVTIYSISQHGLKKGETINLYNNNTHELLYDSAMVVNVVDNFIFQIEKTEGNISKKWVNLNAYPSSMLYGGDIEYDINENGDKLSAQFDNAKYTFGDYKVCESLWVNVDSEATELSFAKVVNGVECQYYVRKFKRLPNFKFATDIINEETIYKKGSELLKTYGKDDFESHSAKAGFSNTSYSDDVNEIVFTDDIDVSYLKDNLGRPLSEIYLTIVKNNQGYKEWYGIEGRQNLSDEAIEYSHCFGRNDAQFLLSDYYRLSADISKDVRDITIEDQGLYGNKDINYKDEKGFGFYGDLCCFSPIECTEQKIQSTMGRFNTVQREIQKYDNAEALKYFKQIVYDEVAWDENSEYYNSISSSHVYRPNYSGSNLTQKTKEVATYKEGYYYQMHYRVPIKKVSDSLTYSDAEKYTLFSIEYMRVSTFNKDEEFIFDIQTDVDNMFVLNEKLPLYDLKDNVVYELTVTNIINSRRFEVAVKSSFYDMFKDMDKNDYAVDRFVILKRREDTPEYAQIVTDGSLRYYWRSVVTNGVEEEASYYPFTNGAFYITTPINFYLRRQDPFKMNLSIVNGEGNDEILDYTPDGEDVNNYPEYIVDETYESSEIDDCTYELFNDAGTNPNISRTYNTVKSIVVDGKI